MPRLRRTLCHPPLAWLALLAIAVATAVGAPRAAAPVAFDETPLTIETSDGHVEFTVELASSPAQRQQGLMFRDQLSDDRGMLFDFGIPQPVSMWMRNTYIPLDMLFIRADGRISQIAARTEPLSDKVIASREPVRAVLELRGGLSAELGIAPGDRVDHPLFETP